MASTYRAPRTFLCLAALLTAASGCVLPMGTAAPQPATTSGQGKVSIGARGEVPTVDLLETQENSDYNTVPFPVVSFEVAYGIHDQLDLEAEVNAALLFVVPISVGAAIGPRMSVINGRDFKLAVAARIGGVTSGSSDAEDDPSGDEYKLSAFYGSGSFSGQIRLVDWLWPGLSGSYYRVWVREQQTGQADVRYGANIGAATFYLDFTPRGRVHFGPFVNVIALEGSDLPGTKIATSGGAFVYIRLGHRVNGY